MVPIVQNAPTFASLVQRSGKSMSRIARESEVSISTVSRIASGDRIPSLPMVFKLARTLQVDPSTLLESFASYAPLEQAA